MTTVTAVEYSHAETARHRSPTKMTDTTPTHPDSTTIPPTPSDPLHDR